MVRGSDEFRRSAGPEPLWADAWEIDFAGEAGVGGFVRLSLLPNQGVAWWWTSLITPRLVAVRDHEVPLPRGDLLEVRADGLWGELVCETPLEHWSVGLEAFGIAYDDPADAWGDEWGERLPVGLDLEWEATAEPGGLPAAGPDPGPGGVSYRQPGRVHGEILVGPDRRIALEGTGFRSRASGELDWWSAPLRRRLAWIGREDQVSVVDDPETVDRTVLGEAPVLVTAPSMKPARLARALCRVEGKGGGLGWAEG
ncbi:MAG: hypothetical protein AB1679_19655 [Actinomycetota bacterium]|jgi:hypothetical protein